MTVDELPDLAVHAEVAAFFRIGVKSVENNPLRFGGKKIKGVGWRYPKIAVLGIAGLREPAGRSK